MFALYLTVTLIAAFLCGWAGVLGLIGHDIPKSQAEKLGVPVSWTPVMGTLLAAGTLGLLAGIAVPLLGTLAAAGLVLYFIGAFYVHVRVRDYDFTFWSVFFAAVVAALAVALAHYGPDGAWQL
ncbi:DoxX family protein [Streptomyces sp. NPDC052309]|uniref:DoxX family protein n=1 Tax=Streptomyces griseicoloratus TaxID=2752516 RepID=A0A926L5Z9_9ACTN|nr:DoxX family protein [Streptomyces griseicoloratus]MBD0422054.1 DoxX family protein [Streptomyces griseicoloratus]